MILLLLKTSILIKVGERPEVGRNATEIKDKFGIIGNLENNWINSWLPLGSGIYEIFGVFTLMSSN